MTNIHLNDVAQGAVHLIIQNEQNLHRGAKYLHASYQREYNSSVSRFELKGQIRGPDVICNPYDQIGA